MPRGRITPPADAKPKAPRRVSSQRRVGNGPPCPHPDNHGYTLFMPGAKKPYWCSHSAHGGNGKFYAAAEEAA
jgi:hypothetical protein